jgi:hypothetical protein
MALGEAREERARLIAKKTELQAMDTSGMSERAKRARGREIAWLDAAIGELRRHCGNLQHAANATDNYNGFAMAIEELFGESALLAVLARKAEMQAEFEDQVRMVPRSDGKILKPLHERVGGTPGQIAALALQGLLEYNSGK